VFCVGRSKPWLCMALSVQLKIGMLESQATEQAAIARRRMEEQTASLKGEAAMARQAEDNFM
jgi:hypothetical protein